MRCLGWEGDAKRRPRKRLRATWAPKSPRIVTLYCLTLSPTQSLPRRADSTLTHALGRIAERDGRVLRVVYNASVIPPRIVTVYFDRRQRGKT